ncbi:MAG: hypothetical protein J6B54_02020 [Clostridia bacterium]|nr:hypothetical protein [Clostridia bacterium]
MDKNQRRATLFASAAAALYALTAPLPKLLLKMAAFLYWGGVGLFQKAVGTQ